MILLHFFITQFALFCVIIYFSLLGCSVIYDMIFIML